MRRNRISPFQPVRRRNGVTASVMQRDRSVHTPVSFVMSLSGFALRLPVSAAHTSHRAGPRDRRNARTLSAGIAESGMRNADFNEPILDLENQSAIRSPQSAFSVVLLQIHPAVQARHLIAVAIEHQRLAH